MRRRLGDLEEFDPQQVTKRDDPKIDGLEASIAEAFSDIFGADSASFNRYRASASLDTAGFNFRTETPHHEVIEGLVRGKGRSIELLRTAILSLEEKMQVMIFR
jgi:hypothetical protein